MTMNYCGRCGSANGSTARFCRQCGTDLSSQAAASSSSAPFNVEFSTRPAKKNQEKEATPAPSESELSVEADPAPSAPSKRLAASAPTESPSDNSEGMDQDPKAISASLRR